MSFLNYCGMKVLVLQILEGWPTLVSYLLLKENIAKELVKTELEIDSLECDLKLVTTDSENRDVEKCTKSFTI
jgi:hypothetical protein